MPCSAAGVSSASRLWVSHASVGKAQGARVTRSGETLARRASGKSASSARNFADLGIVVR
jgi:hypothetical protein